MQYGQRIKQIEEKRKGKKKEKEKETMSPCLSLLVRRLVGPHTKTPCMQIQNIRYENPRTSHLNLHAIFILFLEAHGMMASTVPVLRLTGTVGTAGTTVE